ncbi:MAG: acyltransferase [Flavobacterium sp.]|nr:MAG: acyltransferase [Flavobacterium sp.]
MEQSNSRSRIFGLDLMRAAAIILVLFGHCAWIFPKSNTAFTALMALSGFLGVEVFFVLSGFLIGRIIYREFVKGDFTIRSVMHFLRRRWFRTFPNYFLILIVNILIAFYIGYSIDGLWKYFFFVQNFASPMLPFFTESWSLSVEELAYFLLPFALLAAFSVAKPKDRSLRFLTVTLLLIATFIITKVVYNSHHLVTTLEEWNLAVKSVVIFRLDSIFIGVLCAWIYENYRNFWKKTQMFWMFCGMTMIGFYTFGVGRFQIGIERFPFFWNVIYLPLSSLTVAFFLPMLSEWKTEKSFIRKPVTFISLISYSVYLVHYGIVLQLLKQFVDTESLPFLHGALFTAAYLAITIVLSYLLYRFYEKPMMDRRETSNAQ